ncbi:MULTISPECIES: 5-formyltetrahydrofolate cyclo-ligase [unclassified Acinetobacter]|uniref:5-formyltetrahydrofolate cyclo-ligase n=1 Tax=unclassified Acinetobacter TaxID=196816 RepID=UPI002575230B|nr:MULTISPECIES: 5-formyltetrahydrofolate cyclo-ligase [unclassified Acinetobacter]MDM1763448.1 5-formyltetrahydrofolate cyclo-ligase [Acinetobacter sp. 226-1]MDM1766927.1 5-formyltetrahydrofolate cyclo-ligase [Acinetobacter sp. 226-4]
MSNQTLQLRKQLRSQRRQLTAFQQQQHAQAVLQHLRHYPRFFSAKNIGIYLDGFGELRTQHLIELCFKHQKNVYLPIICNMNQSLRWVKISHQQYRNKRFVLHKLGMFEPMASRGLHVSCLDLLLMPLLACDLTGARMGMGGGFYDRTLASAPYKPYRLGLAHDFQFFDEKFVRNPWDQALHGLVTPRKLLHFQRQISQ